MKDFGYTINKDRQIDFDKGDMRVAKFLKESEPTYNICFACGTCAATCSAGQFTDFSLRKTLTFIRRGELGETKNEISKCMLCGKCYLACPRGVNTRKIILKIKEAVEKYNL